VSDLSNLQPHQLLGALALGGAGAVGVRSLKNLWDMYKDQDSANSVDKFIPSPTANRAKIPVTVSPEEAQQLVAQGISVKSASLDPTFLDKFLLGAGTVGGAALGWNAVDKMYDNQRLSGEQLKLDAAKKRVQGLLTAHAQPQDAALGGALKVAETAIMKTAFEWPLAMAGHGVMSLVNSIPVLPYVAGGGATLVAASAFNESRKRNKALNNAKAIAEYARALPTQAPVAELEPVLAKTAGKQTEWFKKLQAGMKKREAERTAQTSTKTAALKAVLGAPHARPA
jgi:hypothetical protein